MKTSLRCTVLVIALAFARQSEAVVRLDLSVEPKSGLPALSPTLHITVTNDSSESAKLPNRVVLKATRAGDAPFIARGSRDDDFLVASMARSGPVTLAPHEVLDLTQWASPSSPVWYVLDDRLYPPGNYQLQLIADDDLATYFLADDVARLSERPELNDAIISNEASYTVKRPAGADDAVWQLIRGLADGTGWSRRLGQMVVTKYPSSTYAAYTSGPDSTAPSETISEAAAAIRRGPDTPFAPWFRVSIAVAKCEQAWKLLEAEKVDEAVVLYEEAKRLLDQVGKDAKDPVLRKYVLDMSVRVLTREQVEREIAVRAGRVPEKVTVIPVCTKRTSEGGVAVWFAYSNPTSHEIRYAPGSENKFTPPPFDRHQPTVFPAGYFDMALGVPIDGPELTWHLGGESVVAKVKDLPDCDDDREPSRP